MKAVRFPIDALRERATFSERFEKGPVRNYKKRT